MTRISRLWLVALLAAVVVALPLHAGQKINTNAAKLDTSKTIPAKLASFTVVSVICQTAGAPGNAAGAFVRVKNGGAFAGVASVQAKYTSTTCTDPNYAANWCKAHPPAPGMICVPPPCTDTKTVPVSGPASGSAGQSSSVNVGQEATVALKPVPGNATNVSVTVTPGSGAPTSVKCGPAGPS
jgi:hypothetical protein